MNAITNISRAVGKLMSEEPGLRLSAEDNSFNVGFWSDTAMGRRYVCAMRPTLEEAYAAATERRAACIAEAVVEADIRAEVEARMAKAA